MRAVIAPFTDEWTGAVKAFNSRLRQAGVAVQFRDLPVRGHLDNFGIGEPRQDLAAALGVPGLRLSVDLTDLEQAPERSDRRYRHIPCNVVRDALSSRATRRW